MKFSTQDEVNQWVRDAASLWLFLDYDGTLVQFTRTPDVLKPNPKLVGLLHNLARKNNIRITIITGRRLQDMHTLIPVDGIFIAATYGLEVQTPSGEIIQRETFTSVRSYLAQLKPQWEQVIDKKKGFHLEDKGWALALHARYAPTSEAECVLSRAQKLVDPDVINGKYQIVNQNKFLEISPVTANKAQTVSFLLKRFPMPKARLLYLGDDDNDSQAFRIIHSHGGIAITVAHYFGRIQAQGGDFIIKSPQATRRWLEKLSNWYK